MIAWAEGLYRCLLCGKTASKMTGLHVQVTGHAGHLVGREDSIQVSVAEPGECGLDLVDSHEIDADSEVSHSAALSA